MSFKNETVFIVVSAIFWHDDRRHEDNTGRHSNLSSSRLHLELRIFQKGRARRSRTCCRKHRAEYRDRSAFDIPSEPGLWHENNVYELTSHIALLLSIRVCTDILEE